MRIRKDLSAKMNARFEGFAPEIIVVFLSVLIIIFLDWPPFYRFLIVFFAYYSIALLPMWFKPGVSLGKYIAKTKIVNLDLQAPSILKLHGREISKWALGFLTLGLYFIVAFIVFAHRDDHRSLHDLLWRTKVIQSDIIYDDTSDDYQPFNKTVY